MKKYPIYIFLTLICSIAVIMGLMFAKLPAKNEFNRKIINIQVIEENVTKLKSNRFSFAGILATNIVLQDHQNPTWIYMVDKNLQHQKPVLLHAPQIFVDKLKANIGVFETYKYVSNNSGNLVVLTQDTTRLYTFNGSFDETQSITANSFLVRLFKIIDNKRRIAIAKIKADKGIQIKKELILPKQGDGFFSNDGWLHYDRENSRLYYMFFYKGEYLCLDTNLNVLYNGKTIDTVSTAKINLTEHKTVSDKGKEQIRTTQRTPPKLVNHYLTTYKDNIYFHSLLAANNEGYSVFRQMAVIDVYSSENGRYKYSFYLPKYKDFKLRSFEVRDNIIFAIFDKYLIQYRISDKATR